jgi:hypothetical protein
MPAASCRSRWAPADARADRERLNGWIAMRIIEEASKPAATNAGAAAGDRRRCSSTFPEGPSTPTSTSASPRRRPVAPATYREKSTIPTVAPGQRHVSTTGSSSASTARAIQSRLQVRDTGDASPIPTLRGRRAPQIPSVPTLDPPVVNDPADKSDGRAR